MAEQSATTARQHYNQACNAFDSGDLEGAAVYAQLAQASFHASEQERLARLDRIIDRLEPFIEPLILQLEAEREAALAAARAAGQIFDEDAPGAPADDDAPPAPTPASSTAPGAAEGPQNGRAPRFAGGSPTTPNRGQNITFRIDGTRGADVLVNLTAAGLDVDVPAVPVDGESHTHVLPVWFDLEGPCWLTPATGDQVGPTLAINVGRPGKAGVQEIRDGWISITRPLA